MSIFYTIGGDLRLKRLKSLNLQHLPKVIDVFFMHWYDVDRFGGYIVTILIAKMLK
jgi:hypothetical protein